MGVHVPKLFPALAALILLSACEARIGREGEDGNQTAGTSADGKSEEGTFSIDAPGFAMEIDIPKAIADNAEIDSDSGILYPGSELSGMHIQASEGGNSGSVELRFTSVDAPDKVAAWYRDPARAADFTVASAAREGDAIVISGADKKGGDPFTLRLIAGEGGGTDGRLSLSDRG